MNKEKKESNACPIGARRVVHHQKYLEPTLRSSGGMGCESRLLRSRQKKKRHVTIFFSFIKVTTQPTSRAVSGTVKK